MKKQIVSILAVLLFVGCATTSMRLMTPPSDQYTLYARGLSTDQMVEEEADEVAILNARNQLAATLEARLKSLTKRAREQVGIGKDAELNSQYSIAIKQTVDQALNFSSPHAIAETKWVKKLNAYRAEVIYKVQIGPAKEQMMENIKQRKKLYERFRTGELFKELEKEIDKERANKTSEQ